MAWLPRYPDKLRGCQEPFGTESLAAWRGVKGKACSNGGGNYIGIIVRAKFLLARLACAGR